MAVLLATREGPVLTLTLNRPERRNACNPELWRALRQALRDLEDDRSVRVVVLAGAGGAFCAGADLEDREADQHPLIRMRVVNEIVERLHGLPVPTVAKVEGVAVGAGWNLALACDLVVATPQARFSQIFARRGLSLDAGGSWLLPRLVGLQQAKRLALLAEMIGADEAHQLGLVTYVRDATEIEAFVGDLTARLAAGPPIALAQSKALLDEGTTRSLPEALAAEARAQSINFATDAGEAFQAFLDKTEPEFTGRWRAGPLDASDEPERVDPGPDRP